MYTDTMGAATREKILAHLKKNASDTVAGLSRALGTTIPNIRHHLKALMQAGLIEAVVPPPTLHRSKGRPSGYYRLSLTARPHNLHHLINALLRFTLAWPQSAPAAADPLSELANHMFDFSDLPSGLTPRLNHALSQLNLHYYQARWEANAAGPQVKFRNCPYAAILPHHPELCRLDQKILESFTGYPVKMTAQIDPGLPHSACVFQISSIKRRYNPPSKPQN